MSYDIAQPQLAPLHSLTKQYISHQARKRSTEALTEGSLISFGSQFDSRAIRVEEEDKPPHQKRRRESPIHWNNIRDIFTSLYLQPDMNLDQTMHLLRVQYGFHATRHTYKKRIRQWGIFKNQKTNPVKQLEPWLMAYGSRRAQSAEARMRKWRVAVNTLKFCRDLSSINLPPSWLLTREATISDLQISHDLVAAMPFESVVSMLCRLSHLRVHGLRIDYRVLQCQIQADDLTSTLSTPLSIAILYSSSSRATTLFSSIAVAKGHGTQRDDAMVIGFLNRAKSRESDTKEMTKNALGLCCNTWTSNTPSLSTCVLISNFPPLVSAASRSPIQAKENSTANLTLFSNSSGDTNDNVSARKFAPLRHLKGETRSSSTPRTALYRSKPPKIDSTELPCWFLMRDRITHAVCQFDCSRGKDFNGWRRGHLQKHQRRGDISEAIFKIAVRAKPGRPGRLDLRERTQLKWIATNQALFGPDVSGLDVCPECPEPGHALASPARLTQPFVDDSPLQRLRSATGTTSTNQNFIDDNFAHNPAHGNARPVDVESRQPHVGLSSRSIERATLHDSIPAPAHTPSQLPAGTNIPPSFSQPLNTQMQGGNTTAGFNFEVPDPHHLWTDYNMYLGELPQQFNSIQNVPSDQSTVPSFSLEDSSDRQNGNGSIPTSSHPTTDVSDESPRHAQIPNQPRASSLDCAIPMPFELVDSRTCFALGYQAARGSCIKFPACCWCRDCKPDLMSMDDPTIEQRSAFAAGYQFAGGPCISISGCCWCNRCESSGAQAALPEPVTA